MMEYDIHTLLDGLTLGGTLFVIYLMRVPLAENYERHAEQDTIQLHYVVRAGARGAGWVARPADSAALLECRWREPRCQERARAGVDGGAELAAAGLERALRRARAIRCMAAAARKQATLLWRALRAQRAHRAPRRARGLTKRGVWCVVVVALRSWCRASRSRSSRTRRPATPSSSGCVEFLKLC